MPNLRPWPSRGQSQTQGGDWDDELRTYVDGGVDDEAARAVAAEATKQPLDADLTAIAALDSATPGAIASDGAGWIKKTYTQLKAALGIGLADVSGLGTAAALASDTDPTLTANSDTRLATQKATRAYADAVAAALVNSSPGTLDTLKELADALGDDPNFATTMTTLIGTKLAKSANFSDVANAATALANLGGAPTLPDSGAEITTAGPTAATINKTYRINTTSNAVAMSLPSAPAVGSQVLFKVTAPDPVVNAFTWSTSGSDVVNRTGGATTSTLKIPGAWALFTYIGSNIWVKQEGEPLAALDARYSGLELGYAERTTNDTTTNTATDDTTLASNKISGLSVTVVGTGRPVQIEFYCAGMYSGTANINSDAVLLVNGVTSQYGQMKSPGTGDGGSVFMSRRLVLTAGVSYTFEIAKVVGAAGTANYKANAAYPMYLAVTGR